MSDKQSQIIQAAIHLFSNQGYYKTTTAQIAKEVGVSQPYVFHFFRNKEELFMEVIEQAFQKVHHEFAQAPASTDMKETMGNAFGKLVASHREEILLLMQAFTIPEPAIRQSVREKMLKVHDTLKARFRETGAADPEMEATLFVGCGMTIVLAEVLDAETLSILHC